MSNAGIGSVRNQMVGAFRLKRIGARYRFGLVFDEIEPGQSRYVTLLEPTR
jgi:hypothetical protein